MREHNLKIDIKPFDDLLSGAKTCEVRNDDRGFQVGDTVRLNCADGRIATRAISHIQRGYGLPEEVCVLSYTRPAPAPCDELETVAQAYVNSDGDCEQVDWLYGDGPDPDFMSLVTRQNAEELLAAERMKLEATAKVGLQLTEQIETLEADNKRLREALEPFAEYGEDYFDKDHNGNPLPDEQGVGWIYMNFGNFRKARAALGEVKP